MNGILAFLIDVLSTPAILVALIAVLGSVLQKKKFNEVVTGGLKTFVGFLVITGGAVLIQSALAPFSEMFQQAFNITGVVPNNEVIVAVALNDYGTLTALVMLAGMIINILLARITRFKYIYLTGHCTLYMACMITVILSITNMSYLWILILGGLALGISNTIMPAFCQKYVTQITGNDSIGLGHTGDLAYAFAGWLGQIFKKNKVSTEDINFPQSLTFLRDSTVSITITMSVVYLIVALFCGPVYIQESLSDGTNYLVYAMTQAGSFAAGVYVILAGVRMVLNEIVPAFKGISEKLVPNAIPALDCPIVYAYAPNAVLIGFIASFIGGVACMLTQIALGMVVVIPGVVPHFFCGSTAGVFGNATGGIKGCILGAFANGIIISFLPNILLPLMSDLGFAGTSFADSDYGAVGAYLGYLANAFGQVGVVAGIFFALFLLFACSAFKARRQKMTETE